MKHQKERRFCLRRPDASSRQTRAPRPV